MSAVFQADRQVNLPADRKLFSIVFEDTAPSIRISRNARQRMPVDHNAGLRRVESSGPSRSQLRSVEDDDLGWSNWKVARDELESILEEIAFDVGAGGKRPVLR